MEPWMKKAVAAGFMTVKEEIKGTKSLGNEAVGRGRRKGEEVIVVGIRMEHPTAPLHQTPQLDQEVVEVDLEETATGSEELNLQIAMAHRLVGMIHVVVVAHLKTETADIVAAVIAVMVTVAATLEPAAAAATWSR